ncbi:MAG: NAD(P)/FAD-dependent oxidoreductase, partial [Armatimonadota bacterium]
MNSEFDYQFDYLIVGNSTAAVGAIEAIRSRDRSASIGVIAAETEQAYSRPLITYYMCGKVAENNVFYRPPDFYRKMGVTCLLGVQAESVSTRDQAVALSTGKKARYGKLLLAAGGAPIAPGVPGIDRPGVFFMNTLEDARRAKGWLSHMKRAVVVGAGLTGLKTAEALVEMGQEVMVVELADRVLPTALDRTASEMVRQAFVERGVYVLTDTRVLSFNGYEGSNDLWTVTMNTGESIACDTAFITIGIRPRTELVAGSDIKTAKGILVDRNMRTNVDNVYAAGDIAEAFDPLIGGSRVVPILPNAYIGGRVAGLNMSGADAVYNLGMSVNSVSFFGLPVMSAGFAAQEEGDGFRVLTNLDGTRYRKIVIRDGKLVGFILVGNVEKAGLMTGIMRAGVDVAGLETKLLEGSIRLIDLPRELVQER